MWPILNLLKWSLNCGARGVWPQVRHDGSDFVHPQDSWRSSRCSLESLGVYLITCEFRGDWPALYTALCMRAWNHKVAPCMFCNCRKSQLQLLLQFFVLTLPFSDFGFPISDSRFPIPTGIPMGVGIWTFPIPDVRFPISTMARSRNFGIPLADITGV